MAITPGSNSGLDYSSIMANFAPLQQNLEQQKTLANQRYAQNQADIKNIFGNLSTIRAADRQKIADQFKQSLVQQQQAVASRTAEARQATAAGTAGMQAAGAELGGGPVAEPTQTLAGQAAEQGIADANKYQTTWEGLQGAMQGQTQQNLENAITGYGFQQAQAQQDLARSFQDKLAGLDAQNAQIQSQIAQSKQQYDQAIASNNFDAAQKALDRTNALKVAQARANATIQAAKIRKGSSGGSATPKLTGIDEWMASATKAKVDPTQVMGAVSDIIDKLSSSIQKKTQTGKTAKAPTQAQVLRSFTKQYGGSPAYSTGVKYIQKYTGLK